MVSPDAPRSSLPPVPRKVATVADLWQTLVDLFWSLVTLLDLLLHLVMAWALLIAWVAWWLWGVNWVHAWDWLRRGAWVAVVLLVVLGALVWSQVAPGELNLGLARVPNFWWQLVATALLACLALFCGWVQGVMGWLPADVPVYPAEATHDDTHGHEHPVGAQHGHDEYHEDEPQAEDGDQGLGHG
jgi:hypothetical protein